MCTCVCSLFFLRVYEKTRATCHLSSKISSLFLSLSPHRDLFWRTHQSKKNKYVSLIFFRFPLRYTNIDCTTRANFTFYLARRIRARASWKSKIRAQSSFYLQIFTKVSGCERRAKDEIFPRIMWDVTSVVNNNGKRRSSFRPNVDLKISLWIRDVLSRENRAPRSCFFKI